MHKVEEVEIENDLIASNRSIAERNRELLIQKGVAALDISGAIGSGKTSLIEEAIKGLDMEAGVVAGDVLARFDAERFKSLGAETVELNTGKECHLDAHLVSHALEELPLERLEVVFLENVGNLICPTDFDLGAHSRVVVVSVTEGEDIVEKHPMLFYKSHLAIINKVDIAGYVGTSPEKMSLDARNINPGIKVLQTSVRKGGGIDRWLNYVAGEVKGLQEGDKNANSLGGI